MANVTRIKFHADNIGMASSSLCLIHCLITPFIFIAQTCTASCCADCPNWWKSIDFFFLLISFFAAYYAAKNTSKNWVKISFYFLFSLLTLLVVIQHTPYLSLSVYLNYFVAFLLFSLHIYNKRWCKCSTRCCKG